MGMKIVFPMVLILGLSARLAWAGESSLIRGVVYDPGARVLAVTFTKGGTYEYADVGPEVAAAIGRAESKSHAVHELLKDRFASRKREPPNTVLSGARP